VGGWPSFFGHPPPALRPFLKNEKIIALSSVYIIRKEKKLKFIEPTYDNNR
jgi:hypothetical protein